MAKRKSTTTKTEPTIRTRGVEVRANSWNEDDRTATVVISTETPVRMGEYEEVLLQKGAQYPAKVPFLDSHNRWEIADHIGSVTGIRIEDGALIGDVRLARTGGGDMAAALIADGHLTDVSVGYRIDDEVFIRAGESVEEDGKTFNGPMYLVKKWRVMEVSAVSIGADPMAKIRAQDGGDPEAANNSDKHTPAEPEEDSSMTEEERKAQELKEREAKAKADAEDTRKRQEEIDAEAERRFEERMKAERKREADIRSFCRKHGATTEFADAAIADGLGMDKVREKFLEDFDKHRSAIPSSVHVTRDEADTFARGAADAILVGANALNPREGRTIRRERGGVVIEEENPAYVSDEGRELLRSTGGGRLRPILVRCLELGGVSPSRLAGLELPELYRMVKQRSAPGTHTPSDFPAIFENALNKILGIGFVAADTTWQVWCRTITLNDLRPHPISKRGMFTSLRRLNDSAEVPFGTFGAAKKETLTPYEWSRRVAFEDRFIINDDLGSFTTMLSDLSMAAGRTVNEYVYYLLLSNPTMAEDNDTLFHSDHGNYVASGSGAPTVARLNTMYEKFKTQTDTLGKPLNISPRFLLVPPALYGTARELMASQYVPASSSFAQNIWQGQLEVVSDAHLQLGATVDSDNGTLTGTGSSTAWYGAADPNRMETIVVGFYGSQSPVIETDRPLAILGEEARVTLRFGAVPGDFRGMFKDDGVAGGG